VRGVNSVGLRRSGFNEDARRALKDAYRILFRSALPLQNALQTLDELEDEHVAHLVNFIRGSKRGFVRADK
jgi:UDP-N-acetylglucosamine acyltransferase